MKKLLVVYDVSYPSVPGGGQRRLYEVCKRLEGLGWSIDWLCFDTWSEHNKEISDSINYIGLPGFKGLYNKKGSRRILEPIEFLIALYRARINLDHYDVIWSGQWPLLHLIIWSFKKRIRKKLVVDWWEVWGSTWLEYSKSVGIVGYFLEKSIINRLSRHSQLILISNHSLTQIKDLNINFNNVQIVHNGINFSDLEKILVIKKFDLSYIGRLKDHKNIDLLLRAIHFIELKYKYKISAIIVGEGPELEKLKNLSQELDLVERIKFKEAISDNKMAYTFVSEGRIFVNPSTKEGGGSITLLEAFALGLPVIAFDSKDGIDKDLLGHNIRGLLVHDISFESLGESIYMLIRNQSVINQMSKEAKQFSKQFGWDEITMSYKKVFDRIST